MVGFYPLCAFGENRVAASIDTPLHAFLPFDHVDHLHPDWAIALAASANGQAKLEEFNTKYGRKIIWVPWQRPGFELALMLKQAVEANPGCRRLDPRRARPVHLGRHAEGRAISSSVLTIDQMGQFVQDHRDRSGAALFGGARVTATVADREAAVVELFPALRGAVSSNRRVIGHYDGSDDAIGFANSHWARRSLPDGHELPGSLPAHAHLADVHPLEPRRREPGGGQGADRRSASRNTGRTTPPTTSRSPSRLHRSCATATRRSWSFRGWGCSASARTSARRASPPSSSSTRFT